MIKIPPTSILDVILAHAIPGFVNNSVRACGVVLSNK